MLKWVVADLFDVMSYAFRIWQYTGFPVFKLEQTDSKKLVTVSRSRLYFVPFLTCAALWLLLLTVFYTAKVSRVSTVLLATIHFQAVFTVYFVDKNRAEFSNLFNRIAQIERQIFALTKQKLDVGSLARRFKFSIVIQSMLGLIALGFDIVFTVKYNSLIVYLISYHYGIFLNTTCGSLFFLLGFFSQLLYKHFNKSIRGRGELARGTLQTYRELTEFTLLVILNNQVIYLAKLFSDFVVLGSTLYSAYDIFMVEELPLYSAVVLLCLNAFWIIRMSLPNFINAYSFEEILNEKRRYLNRLEQKDTAYKRGTLLRLSLEDEKEKFTIFGILPLNGKLNFILFMGACSIITYLTQFALK